MLKIARSCVIVCGVFEVARGSKRVPTFQSCATAATTLTTTDLGNASWFEALAAIVVSGKDEIVVVFNVVIGNNDG